MRPIFKIIISLIILLAAAGLIYFFFFRAASDTSEQQDSAPERLEVVVAEPVISPSLSFSGDTLWFFNSSGKLFSLALEEDSLKKEFPIPAIDGFQEARWQPDGSSFIIRQNLEGHSKYQFYDAEFRNLVSYPDNLTKPQFAFSGSIVYEWVTGGEINQLKVSDLASTEFRTVADLFRADYRLEANRAKNEVVLYSENQLSPSKIFLVSLETGEFRELSTSLSVQGASFSPDGSRLLVARWDQQNQSTPSLYLQDLSTLDIFVPGLFAGIEQTVWSEDGLELYMTDEKGVKKLDTLSNHVLELYEFGPGGEIQPADLLLHPNRESLFFVDKKTGWLYRVKL